MTRADDAILELLADTELELQPGNIARNIAYSRGWVNRRCRTLVEHGLLEDTGEGYYQIADLGEQYLRGEVAADELEE